MARAQVVAGGADVEADAAVGPLGEGDRVFLRAGERLWFIPVADIRLLESVGNSARVVFGTENVLVQRTLNALEARLPASMFFRASRGQIVNLRWIDRVDDWLGDRLRATLRGQGETVEISRRRAAEFRRRCGL